eukprot:11162310-Lingulodinium_polyedra.AAC.1
MPGVGSPREGASYPPNPVIGVRQGACSAGLSQARQLAIQVAHGPEHLGPQRPSLLNEAPGFLVDIGAPRD